MYSVELYVPRVLCDPERATQRFLRKGTACCAPTFFDLFMAENAYLPG